MIIKRKDIEDVHELLLDSDANAALLSSEEHIAYLNADVFPDKFFYYAEEVIFGFNLCIYLHRQSCLEEQMNQNILIFRSSGLLGHWANEFVDRSYLKETKTREPKVLVNKQLYGAYELLTLGLAMAGSMFLIEICSSRFSMLRKYVKKI